MHRSGTSALTAVLSMLGACPGNSLIPAIEDINPKGFWEHADIVALHDELLQALGFTWFDERPLPEGWWLSPLVVPYSTKLKEIILRDFYQTSLWILKDPRCCRLLPLWLDIFKETNCIPHFVIVIRNPSEVVSSLTERAGFHEAKSYLLWLRYVLDSEKWSRGHPRAIVSYEQLLLDWRLTTDSIANRFGIEWPSQNQRGQQSIEEFLDPSLRHHAGDNFCSSKHEWAAMAHELYEELLSLAREGKSAALQGAREVEKNVDELQNILSPLLQSLMGLKEENTYLHSELKNLHSEIERIKSTFSWEVTKPLRAIGNMRRLQKLILTLFK